VTSLSLIPNFPPLLCMQRASRMEPRRGMVCQTPRGRAHGQGIPTRCPR
jgi:hypothetical protein